MKFLLSTFAFMFLLNASPIFAQNKYDFRTDKQYKNWVKLVQKLEPDFYKSEEAVRIADNVLLYQLNTGGWPKNIYMPKELTAEERVKVIAAKSNVDEGTIDNTATTTEIEFLAKVYVQHKDEKYKKGVLDGLNYLFEAQYDNGGWPQCYPRTKGYVTQIQYNDNSNVNVLELMREVYTDHKLYSFLPETMKDKARKAFDKGIDCILKTQLKQDGKLAVWCAQYDHKTLQPVKARAYELVSLSGQESDNIVLLLMSLKNPSQEIINAVEGAVEWFKKSQINGIKVESYTNDEGKKDRRVIECEDCPPMWARFYEIDTNRPFFCDRDGIKRYSLAEIGHERRNGYSWYNSDGLKVFKRYDKWKKEISK